MRNLLALSLVAAAAGCSTGSDLGPGAMLSLDYFANTDVVGFHFEVTRVACDASDTFEPFTYKANIDLLDGIFPSEITFLENKPFNEETRHLGADLFVSLDPGCYDVMAVPASEILDSTTGFTPSADCTVATDSDITVEGRETTEVLLLSQCVGDETGALDTLVLLNNPPVIAVSIDEKFNYECETVEVCVTAFDPNDDPIEVTWTQSTNYNVFGIDQGPLEVVGFEDGHRVWRNCANITTDDVASYEFNVDVHDLGWQNGSQARIEDFIGAPSSSDLTFPIFTAIGEEPLCFDDAGNLGPAPGVSITRAAGCDYTTVDEYYCTGAYGIDPTVQSLLCDGGSVVPEALYPSCDDVNIGDTTGHGPGNPFGPGLEVCNGVDDDGDGQVDEGWVEGTKYEWTTSGGNPGAGVINYVDNSYNGVTDVMFFETNITPTNGRSPDGFTVAINDGPNPKGQSDLALLYFDGTAAGTPIITVYTYNGQNTNTSYYDGSSDAGTQAPDRIISSLLDPTFVLDAARVVEADGSVTMRFAIDTEDINNHNPVYPANYDWTGMLIGSKAGIWYHPYADASFQYVGGWLSNVTRAAEGWIDLSNRNTTPVDVCEYVP